MHLTIGSNWTQVGKMGMKMCYNVAMNESVKREVRATLSLIGTIIGAGIFGVPFVISRVGITVGLAYFIVIGALVIIAHWYFAQIALSIKERHRLPGFANALLGIWGKRAAGLLGIVGGWLALTAYLILGGTFLWILLSPYLGGTEISWVLIYSLVIGLVVLGGLGFVAKSEMVMTSALILALLVIVAVSAPHLNIDNLLAFNQKNIFLPYGVILFSLLGFAAIPQLEDLSRGKQKSFLRSIMFGTVISAILTAIFGFVIAGVTGAQTTPEAILGLEPLVGSWIMIFGAIFGFLAVITSCFVFLLNQIETFRYDYDLSYPTSWILSLGVPLLIFAKGGRDFIGMIGLTGGVAGGLTGALVAIMYLSIPRKKKLPLIGYLGVFLVITLFVLGAIAELFNYFQQ